MPLGWPLCPGQCGDKSWLQHVQQAHLVGCEVVPALVAPDAHVTQVSPLVPGVQVHTPVQAILVQEVVEKFSFLQLFNRQHIGGTHGHLVALHQGGDGVVKLVVAFIGPQVQRVHVDLGGLCKAQRIWLPDVTCIKLRPQQLHDQVTHDFTDFLLFMRLSQGLHDLAQQNGLLSTEVHDPTFRQIDRS